MVDTDQDTVQDIVDQRRTLLAAQPPEPKDTVGPESGIPRQPKAQLPPQPTGKLSAEDLRDIATLRPRPELKLQDVTGPQPLPQGNPFDVFKDPMVVLAGLSSLFTRRPLIGAMNYAAGAMKGYREGQNEVFNQNKTRFDEALRAAAEQNRIELARYTNIWDRKKDFDWIKIAPKLAAEAAANNDQIMLAAIKSGNWDLVEKILLGRETAQTGVDRATQIAEIRANIAAESKYGQGTPQAQQAKDIVEGMKDGTQPPTTTGMYGMAPLVRAEAARQHFDLARAQLEWVRAQTQMRSLAGPNMTKYFALAQSVQSTIGEVLELSQQLQLGKYPAKNRADLIWLVQTKGGTPEGDLAVRYLGAIKTLKEEFANLAQGGGVPTEPAWSLANEQINQDFGVSSLNASLTEVKRLIGYRVQAIQNIGNQPYNPAGTPQTAAPQGGGGIIRYDSQGNRIQ